MKQRIYYDSSDYAGSVIFWIFLIILIFCCFWWWTPSYDYTDAAYNSYNTASCWSSGWTWAWIIIAILFIWWIFALCFTPLDVSADDNEVRIRRPFRSKRIKMSEIESAEPYQVSKNAKGKVFRTMPIRTFGKWGHYSDDNIGDYFAYYGKPEETTLIRLKNGKKYVVGGTDAKALSEYINSKKS